MSGLLVDFVFPKEASGRSKVPLIAGRAVVEGVCKCALLGVVDEFDQIILAVLDCNVLCDSRTMLSLRTVSIGALERHGNIFGANPPGERLLAFL